MEIERLKAKNYYELIGLLNCTFWGHNKKEMYFEKELSKMCVRSAYITADTSEKYGNILPLPLSRNSQDRV